MSGLQPRTGWSYQGAAPPRVKSMTYVAPQRIERSTMNAVSAVHGILPTSSWVAQSRHRLVVPVPSFPV